MLKPEPLVLALLRLTLPLFWLVMVTVVLTLRPLCTFPKAMLGGFGTTALLEDAHPLTANIAEPFTLTLPFTVPVELGTKVTVSDALCPGDRLKGSAG